MKDPHLDSAKSFLPDRAFGVQSIDVEPEELTQPIVMTVPKEVRSHQRLRVDLDLGAAAAETFVTVAAVDEGVLPLTRFETPDPLRAILVRRGLGIETFETVGWSLLVPPAGPSKSTGGDEDEAKKKVAGRIAPVKPVALWSGLVRVPASGKARVTFVVPEYSGSLRIMAIAAGPRRIGRATANVIVRDPLVVQATLPRFLTQGDLVQIPVGITNGTGHAQEIDVELTAENLAVPGLDAAPNEGSPIDLIGNRKAVRIFR